MIALSLFLLQGIKGIFPLGTNNDIRGFMRKRGKNFMLLEITVGNDAPLSITVGEDESSVFKAIGKILLTLQERIPTTLTMSCAYGDIEFEIGKRGTYKQNGIIYPSMFVKESYNYLSFLPSPKEPYEDKYLTCINPESNNYKFYWLKPESDGIHATYGRIGSKRGEAFGVKDLQTPYPSYMYWIRYYEKLSKGYIDQSDIYLNSPKLEAKATDNKTEQKDAPVNTVSGNLYKKLMSYARHVVQNTLVSSCDTVTKEQVRMAKKYLAEAGKKKTVKAFNKWLMKVLVLSPRKERHIDRLLATDSSDFADIVTREDNLITAMEAVAMGNVSETLSESFEAYGIEVYEATEKQKAKVMNKLSDTLKGKVKNIYRVIPQAQKKRFNTYLEKEGIKTVKELWHGSKNENWMSIILNSLQLNPNAAITGKMFGQGIYFAPSSAKSFNYTSYHGTSWAHGQSDTGFMGVYAVAYGKPHDVSLPARYTSGDLKRLGKNCVHAHAGTRLRNDEIIFYDEDAVCLNYIVEFN